MCFKGATDPPWRIEKFPFNKYNDNFPWTQVEPCMSRRRVVSLQRFEHLDIISMFDETIDHGKLFSICFYNNIDSFWRSFSLKFLGKSRAQERQNHIAPPSRHFLGLYSHRP